MEKLYYNLLIPYETVLFYDEQDKRRIDTIMYLNDAINIVDFRQIHSNEYFSSIKKANEFLEDKYFEDYCGKESAPKIACIGHTHIDVAWQWTVAETRQKVIRSFSTVVNLMEQYPEYTFFSSQPQLYKFVKEDAPELYERIKGYIDEGRWEVEGAMWLEADCNVTSGESLVRQILYGKKFITKEFGVDSKVLWLPDVFGYNAAMPQILKKSNVDYFVTSKISWNDTNTIPYDVFMWEGIDGTKILTSFITSGKKEKGKKVDRFTSYNGEIEPGYILGTWERYQNKDINDEAYISYGFGDGGGGPTKDMLEKQRRFAKGIPGCPKTYSGNVSAYLEDTEKKIEGNARLPVWTGELYLELHRGTYTSMGRIKRLNRESEFLYMASEGMNVFNMVLNNTEYPKERFDEGWELILLNQFHDIIPGSSIKEVYDDSWKDYEKILAIGNETLNDSTSEILSNMNIKKDGIAVFNHLGHNRSDIVEVDDFKGNVIDCEGNILSSQVTSSGKRAIFVKDIPSKGYRIFDIITEEKEIEKNISVSKEGLENRFFKVEFDGDNSITSIFDKINNREVVVEKKKANVICAFEDIPYNFDAWDICDYYKEKMWEINDVESVEVVEDGAVRGCLKVVKKFLSSTITQYIYVYSDIARIDFKTTIDWKEEHILLKAMFPVDIHSNKATYDIQFGNVERSTSENTSWEKAQFEVCGQKWVDMSEDNYGVSLLNDCKYGHSIKGDMMAITLLKSATSPNFDADREVHEFTYSIYPHSDNWRGAGTVNMAYELNSKLIGYMVEAQEGNLESVNSLVSVDADNIVIETATKAENSDDIIVRMYEAFNRRNSFTLSFAREIDNICECDLMENTIDFWPFEGNVVEAEIKPYEIKTFKVRLK